MDETWKAARNQAVDYVLNRSSIEGDAVNLVATILGAIDPSIRSNRSAIEKVFDQRFCVSDLERGDLPSAIYEVVCDRLHYEPY